MAGKTPTIGRVMARGLAESGVEWAFTVPGESFLGVLDELPGAGIKVIATRHEGGAGFMAEAVAQLTGKPAAVLGTRAVGAANMSVGLHTARQNSTPVVALLGQVRRDFLGREAFQEVDLVESFGRLCKWAGRVDDPATAAEVVRTGLTTALGGRPGPILFSLPQDVLDQPAQRGALAQVAEISVAQPEAPDGELVRDVVHRLRTAQRPAIVAGYGVIAAGARDALIALAERLSVPVFTSWRRPTAFPNDHPNYLGMSGYGSPDSVRRRLAATDFLLVIGSRLSEVSTFDYELPAKRTTWAHVDLEPRTAHAGLAAPNFTIPTDAAAFLKVALEVIPQRWQAAPERVAALAEERREYVAATTFDDSAEWRGPGIHPGRVIATLERVLPANALITSDAGNFGTWPARYFHYGRENGFLGPTSGAMGYGLPSAIAASLVQPGRPIVAICGDGGFAMTMNELETAVRHGTMPVILVFDNRRYGTIAMHQRNEGRDLVATDLGPIDFAAAARACGAQGGRVTRDAEFEPALVDALGAGRPAVIQLELDPRWISPDRFES